MPFTRRHALGALAALPLMPRLAMPDDDHGTLVSVPLRNPAVSRTIGLIHPRGKTLNPVARLFYELLTQRVEARQK
ncbi:LysR substrate-binding domain-containing protein [Achromobacter xylosoxidans]